MGGEKTVKFSAGIGGRTKAVYATDVEESNPIVNNRERVTWEQGDGVRVFCEKAEVADKTKAGTNYADYYVMWDGEMNGTNNERSDSMIEACDGKGFYWGDAENPYIFYAVSPVAEFSGTGSTVAITGTVPAAQSPKRIAAGTKEDGPDFIAVADLDPEYMVAKTTTNKSTSGYVTLQFYPIVTAIQFTLQNGYPVDSEKSLSIKSVSLTSKNHAIAGSFTAALGGWTPSGDTYPTCTQVTDGGKTVTLTFGTAQALANPTAEKNGQSLQLTLFLLPDDSYTSLKAESGQNERGLNDLTLTVVKGDGTSLSTDLAYHGKNGNEGVFIPTHKKSYIKGLMVPEGIKLLKITVNVNERADNGAGSISL